MTVRAPGDENPPQKAPSKKPVPRKPGHVLDTPSEQQEEHIAEPDAQVKRPAAVVPVEKQGVVAKKAAPERSKDRKRREGGDGPRDEAEGEPPGEAPGSAGTTAGHLAHDANYARSRIAKRMGFEQSPSVGDFIEGRVDGTSDAESLASLLPGSVRSHPDLPETEVRPPHFLSPREAMADIYMRTRGRMSRRTKEVLESPDLEDLLDLLKKLHDNDVLVKNGESRLRGPLALRLKNDPGPLLVGLADPRLTEPWRLLLDGWDIWVRSESDDGVELFWEGEAEDDSGAELEIIQSLSYGEGELTLYCRMGSDEDRVTFDGDAFYRLKTRL